MKKLLTGFLVFCSLLVFLHTAAYAQENVYRILSEDGQYLTQLCGACEPGDEYIAQDNRHYRITQVDEAAKTAAAEYIGMASMPDVLLPEEDIIRITVERGKEKYYCIPLEAGTHTRGRGIQQIYDGNEMLNQIILQRKEAIL